MIYLNYSQLKWARDYTDIELEVSMFDPIREHNTNSTRAFAG